MARPAIEESRRIVSSHTAIFDRPPRQTPSFKTVDGPITGNGDIGLTVSGPPGNQRYWISKNDFWKSGPDFHQCGPSLIGGIDVRTKGLEGASYRARQVLYEPVISSKFSLGDGALTIDARVAANDNVIILELKAGGKPFRVDLELWAKDGYGSETASGREEGVRWVARRFGAADLLYPTGAVVAMRCLGTEAASFTLKPGKPVTVVASVVTNHESETYDADARKKAAALTRTEVDRLIAEHNEWWREFWARSYVEVEDKLLEQHYYGSLYIMACCSRNVDFPPGLYGNWITKDRTAWAGDIHLNYNFEAPYWGLYSSNRIELTDPYDTPLLEHLPMFRENARKYLGKKGAYASVGIGPKGLTSRFFDEEGLRKAHGEPPPGESYDDIAGQPMFLGQKCNAV
ncbi:MAG: glycosyl hydrolase family 95 catalytic domain-containing protein, partial [Planctomycetota bacterium]